MSMYKQIRLEKQMTQEQVAKYLGITKQAVSQIENGLTMPKRQTLAKYLRLRGTKTDLKLVEILEEK